MAVWTKKASEAISEYLTTVEPLLTITSDERPPCLWLTLTLVPTASPFRIVLKRLLFHGHLSTSVVQLYACMHTCMHANKTLLATACISTDHYSKSSLQSEVLSYATVVICDNTVSIYFIHVGIPAASI